MGTNDRDKGEPTVCATYEDEVGKLQPPQRLKIRLNMELAKKPRECLEYIIVHELAHLLEPTHNARFVELMDRIIPKWPVRRGMLNRMPLRHENWEY